MVGFGFDPVLVWFGCWLLYCYLVYLVTFGVCGLLALLVGFVCLVLLMLICVLCVRIMFNCLVFCSCGLLACL